jgi:ring-1,2-phenylacetyl-CoA epoxidase subunit PaaD
VVTEPGASGFSTPHAMTAATTPASAPGSPSDLTAAIAAIADPEVPVLSIEDLGILREVRVDEDARTVTVLITPTYSGCPAMDAIRAHIEHVARRRGYAAQVRTRLSPAWTTDWMSAAGRDKLRKFGIAPPGQRSEAAARGPGVTSPPMQPVSLGVTSLMVRRVTCPLCGSDDTEEISRFGSTACKALRRCNTCREPFDEFKTI